MARTQLVKLDKSFKCELDWLFSKKESPKLTDVIQTVSDEHTTPIEYEDVMEYMMCNDGEMPSGGYKCGDGSVYYVFTHINEETAKSILKFYTEENGLHKTLNELAYHLYRDENIRGALYYHFRNVVITRCHKVREISTKGLKKEKGQKYNRPRMFKVLGTDITFVQPDRRKPVYYVSSGHGIVLDERTIVEFY